MFIKLKFIHIRSQKDLKTIISGISLSNHGPRFNHLFFADDSMLFSKATKEDAYGIIKVLNTYTKASGQRANLSKSAIIFQ